MRYFPLLLVVLLACAPPPAPDPRLRETLAGEARPTVNERSAVLSQSEAYSAALRAGRLLPAFNLHTDDYRERVPFPQWRRQVAARWPGAGAPVEIRWRQALHRWEGPELYAIVLWPGEVTQLVWRQDSDGAFLLENVVPR